MSIRIGNYILHHPHNGKIRAINVQFGEAGEFSEEVLGTAIDKWFWEEF